MICRDDSVGAAGQTAPTNGYEPPLKIDYVVVLLFLLETERAPHVWGVIADSTDGQTR